MASAATHHMTGTASNIMQTHIAYLFQHRRSKCVGIPRQPHKDNSRRRVKSLSDLAALPSIGLSMASKAAIDTATCSEQNDGINLLQDDASTKCHHPLRLGVQLDQPNNWLFPLGSHLIVSCFLLLRDLSTTRCSIINWFAHIAILDARTLGTRKAHPVTTTVKSSSRH